jgi:hypothetical protein
MGIHKHTLKDGNKQPLATFHVERGTNRHWLTEDAISQAFPDASDWRGMRRFSFANFKAAMAYTAALDIHVNGDAPEEIEALRKFWEAYEGDGRDWGQLWEGYLDLPTTITHEWVIAYNNAQRPSYAAPDVVSIDAPEETELPEAKKKNVKHS